MKLVRLKQTCAGFALACVCAVMAPAHAGLFDDEEARKAILDLRQKVEANRAASETAVQRLAEELKKSQEDNQQLRRSLVELQNQIETLRADLARLRGQDEQMLRDIADLQRRHKDLAAGIDERFRKFEPAKVTVDGREFVADAAEKREFEASLNVFRKGDFALAQTAFVDFIRRYPQSGFNPSALFWLGNAQYATRDYKEAIANFRLMLTQAPDHVRSAEAMLSIANCQVELKDVKAARKTLEDLVKAYPQSEAAQAANDRLAKLKP